MTVLKFLELFPKTWWLYSFGLMAVFQIVLVFAYPTFIAPIFNKFTPLENQELKEDIDELLNKTGFESKGIFVMDASRRSGHGNAYFTGLGKQKRIVFFDTLMNQLGSKK